MLQGLNLELLKPPLSFLFDLVLNTVDIELLLVQMVIMLYLLNQSMNFLLVFFLFYLYLIVKLTQFFLSFIIFITSFST
jgi:hypothetical protein